MHEDDEGGFMNPFGGNQWDIVGAQAALMQQAAAPQQRAVANNMLAMLRAGALQPVQQGWQANASPQGVSMPAEEMDYLPFDETQNDGSFDSTHEELRFVSLPQRPFRGERIVLTAFSATVTSPENNVVIDPAIYVGAVQIGSTQGRASIAAYAPTAFGVRLSWPSSGQGTRVFIPLSQLVPVTGADVITCTAQCIGRAVR